MTARLSTEGLLALQSAIADYIERQAQAERMAQIVGHPVDPKDFDLQTIKPNPVGAGK